MRTERSLPLFHEKLGLIGKADAVEFEGNGIPYPVEYKHGSRHKRAVVAACDDVQLAERTRPRGRRQGDLLEPRASLRAQHFGATRNARANLAEAVVLVLEANRTRGEESIHGKTVIREPLPLTAE